jgi:hypothetical protein
LGGGILFVDAEKEMERLKTAFFSRWVILFQLISFPFSNLTFSSLSIIPIIH